MLMPWLFGGIITKCIKKILGPAREYGDAAETGGVWQQIYLSACLPTHPKSGWPLPRRQLHQKHNSEDIHWALQPHGEPYSALFLCQLLNFLKTNWTFFSTHICDAPGMLSIEVATTEAFSYPFLDLHSYIPPSLNSYVVYLPYLQIFIFILPTKNYFISYQFHHLCTLT